MFVQGAHHLFDKITHIDRVTSISISYLPKTGFCCKAVVNIYSSKAQSGGWTNRKAEWKSLTHSQKCYVFFETSVADKFVEMTSSAVIISVTKIQITEI